MGVSVLVIGQSGSGKSTSLRNLDPNKVGVFNIASKPLPFRGKLKVINHPSYDSIKTKLAENKLKTYVIDDATYLMQFQNFQKAKFKGYDKFTDMAVEFYNLLETIREKTSDDTVVYLMGHIDRDEQGRTTMRTIGKMLSNQLCVEGLCPIVLMAETDGKDHWFTTINDGTSVVKAPMGMFTQPKIDNDLAIVDKAIREYWGFNDKPEVKEEKK